MPQSPHASVIQRPAPAVEAKVRVPSCRAQPLLSWPASPRIVQNVQPPPLLVDDRPATAAALRYCLQRRKQSARDMSGKRRASASESATWPAHNSDLLERLVMERLSDNGAPGFGRLHWPGASPINRGMRMALRGKIKFYNSDKGYGFIAGTNGESDVYVNETALADGLDRLTKHETVEYEMVKAADGRRRATRCRIAD
jgi:cold shock protein